MQFHGWAVVFHIWHTRPPADPLRPVNPNNTCHLCITAAAGTELAVTFFWGTIKQKGYYPNCTYSLRTGVYNPKAFVLHAASHVHTFVHWQWFSTAASRRSLGSVSVPVWPVTLSGRLPVSLGKQLPYQLADRIWAHLEATGPKIPIFI